MESSASTPPEVRRPEVQPLSEEQKRNYQQDIDRFEEEKFASKNSFPTKLLGWMLLAGFGLQVAGSISNDNYNFGGILLLFVGFGVLKGSQSALRFAVFLVFPGAVLGLLYIAWAVARNEPLEIGRKWRDFHDLKFWTLGVSPCMYFLAESIVAVCAFRLRKIPFWTKTVQRWAAVVALLLLVQSVIFARTLIRQREVRRELSKEVTAAKAYFSTYGGGISLSSIRSSEQSFGELPNILLIEWENSPHGTTEIYRKKSEDSRHSTLRRDHQEWFKLPTGEWGRINIKVVLPKKSD